MAHYHLVTRLDPTRDIAWLKLGYERYHGRWSKPDELAAQKLEAERQKRADTLWKPRLEKLRDALTSPTESRRLKAEKELYQITDPRAVASIWKVFGGGNEKTQLVAIELFSQIDGPGASYCILALAINSPSSEVRSHAGRALKFRDPREVIGWLTRLLRKPYKYKILEGDRAGSVATLLVDGEKFDRRRFYRYSDVNLNFVDVISAMISERMPQSLQSRAAVLADRMLREQWPGLIANAIVQSQAQNDTIRQTLEGDIRTIDDANAQINETNGRAFALLESLTGEKLGEQPGAWREWWGEQLGLSYSDTSSQSKPLYTDTVEAPDVSVILPRVSFFKASCFAAGTLVHTIDGLKKVESLSIGDRVLSQDTTTGALSFQPVLNTTVRSGAATFRLALDGETIVTTGIHRFWQAAKGWTMARDLKPGDRLRAIAGTTTVQSIEPDATQNVYNLNVAENRDFLIGTAGCLVHDVSFVVPVSQPFDHPTTSAQTVPR